MVSVTDAVGTAASMSLNAPTYHPALGNLIDLVGCPRFETELAGSLIRMFRTEFVHFSHFPSDFPQILCSVAEDGSLEAVEQSRTYVERELWRFDPSLNEGIRHQGTSPLISRLDTTRPETPELYRFYSDYKIGERVVAYGSGASGHLGLSVLRSKQRGAFTDDEALRIGAIADFAFPLLARHYAMVSERKLICFALNSLELIEQCLNLTGHEIPKREAEVIARMLYGMTCEGIAIELSIGYETAISYKKRFYQRFMLGNFRDLLNWYLAQFSNASYMLLTARNNRDVQPH